jgi:hypothetical protein
MLIDISKLGNNEKAKQQPNSKTFQDFNAQQPLPNGAFFKETDAGAEIPDAGDAAKNEEISRHTHEDTADK